MSMKYQQHNKSVAWNNSSIIYQQHEILVSWYNSSMINQWYSDQFLVKYYHCLSWNFNTLMYLSLLLIITDKIYIINASKMMQFSLYFHSFLKHGLLRWNVRHINLTTLYFSLPLPRCPLELGETARPSWRGSFCWHASFASFSSSFFCGDGQHDGHFSVTCFEEVVEDGEYEGMNCCDGLKKSK